MTKKFRKSTKRKLSKRWLEQSMHKPNKSVLVSSNISSWSASKHRSGSKASKRWKRMKSSGTLGGFHLHDTSHSIKNSKHYKKKKWRDKSKHDYDPLSTPHICQSINIVNKHIESKLKKRKNTSHLQDIRLAKWSTSASCKSKHRRKSVKSPITLNNS